MELENTWLVQRLKTPFEKSKDIDRAFGGALMMMSKEAWDIIYKICRIDYMGAAEYEFGTLPKAFGYLVQLAKLNELVGFSFVIPKKDIPLNYDREWKLKMARREELERAKQAGVKPKRAKKTVPTDVTDKTVYILCPKVMRDVVATRIVELGQNKKFHTKEGHRFNQALDPITESEKELAGWFELTNHFMFFVDKQMWTAFCELLEVKTE